MATSVRNFSTSWRIILVRKAGLSELAGLRDSGGICSNAVLSKTKTMNIKSKYT